MQCNQSFCGNGFTNGPFHSYNNPPLQCNAGMCPEIVGEGEVTSVTLPDGTVQFFFMPTVKWWAPNVFQYHPNATNPGNNNMNYHTPQWNNNVGTWFVRSIANPLPQNTFNPPCQRCEVPRLHYNSDINMNNCNNGYQLKFHNDNWTSTTDIGYFYPSLRQRDNVLKPCKGNAAVQMETVPATNTVCHYEFVCSKPCNCNAGTKSMSSMSLVEPKLDTKTFSGSTDDCSCEDVRKKRHKRHKEDKTKKSKPKNVICACESTDKIVNADKSIMTYTDMGSSCTPTGGRETQTFEITKPQNNCTNTISQSCCRKAIPMCMVDSVLQRSEVKKAETWHPVTSFSKKTMDRKKSETSIDISDSEYKGGFSSNCSCCSN